MISIYTIINWLLIFSYWLLIVNVILRILIKRRAVPTSMAWLLIIYILPLVGIMIYLLFGELNIGKQRYERSKKIWLSAHHWIKKLQYYEHIIATESSEVAHSIFQLCKHRQGITGLKGNQIQLLHDIDHTIATLINDIKLAQQTINIVFYIWKNDGLINEVTTELIIAAKRGVHCRLMLDSAGSVEFFRSSYPNLLRNAGINVVEALHVNLLRIFLRRMDVRQHRKMILIDNHISYTGSMNMVDPKFFKQNIGIGQWIDIMVRVEGPITSVMNIIFSCDWEIETGEHILLPISDIKFTKFKKNCNHTIQVIASGPGFLEGIIHQTLLTLLYSARKQIIITTPYLVPSDDLLHAICTTAQRGVEVRIIIPRYNDSVLVHWASRAIFSELLESGVIIYQFKGGLLHTKSILVDQQLSLIGTVNLDIRSLWLNFEITLIIDNKNFSDALANIQKDYINNSRLLNVKQWEKRPYLHRIIERLLYFFSPLL